LTNPSSCLSHIYMLVIACSNILSVHISVTDLWEIRPVSVLANGVAGPSSGYGWYQPMSTWYERY
jgi:hypothetical protein